MHKQILYHKMTVFMKTLLQSGFFYSCKTTEWNKIYSIVKTFPSSLSSPIENFCNDLSHSCTYSFEVFLKLVELKLFEFVHKVSGLLRTRMILMSFPSLVSLGDLSVNVKKTDQTFALEIIFGKTTRHDICLYL